MKNGILKLAVLLIGAGMMSGMTGCGTVLQLETAEAVVEKRQEDEIEEMESAALAKEEARANAVIYRVRPYQVEAEDMQKWSEVFFEGETACEPRVIFSNREDAGRVNDLDWKETDWVFQDGGYYRWDEDYHTGKSVNYGITRSLWLEAPLGEEVGSLRWEQEDEVGGTLCFHRFNVYTEAGIPHWPEENIVELAVQSRNTISLVEAEELANKTLEKMGLEYFVIYKSWKTRGYYNISYVRCFDEKNVYPENDSNYLKGDNEDISYYGGEMLTVKVVNDKVKILEWKNPLEILEKEEFFLSDEMLFRLNLQYRSDLNRYVLGVPTTAERENGVDEKMFRIQATDKDGEFWIVPCWRPAQ